jgi:trk system potassium uptake protein TrkH
MKNRIILRKIGAVMLIEGCCMIPMLLVSLLYGESIFPFLISIAVLALLGLLLFRFGNGQSQFSPKEAFLTVAVTWLTLSIFGALPFYLCGQFGGVINCIFESVSGFTTTGASILTDIESLPKGILLWRSFTHFIGGMGILVLASAILPSGKDRSHYLMRAEMPGPTSDKLVPKLSQSSKILYGIYIVMTLLEVIALIIAGVNVYESFNIAFSTAGTGGFAVTNASIAAYDSTTIDVIVSVFMLLFSINFTIYFFLLTGKIRQILKSDELKFFLSVVAISVLLLAWNTTDFYGNFGQALRYTFFAVSSTISTTGFVTANYDLWPELSKTLIVLLMVIGACAGSTGGGVKCSRVLIIIKSFGREIKQIIHPRAVNTLRLDGKPLAEQTISSVLRFFGAYCAIALCATLLISVDNFDFTTNFTGVISCMGNVGPGLASVGPICNFDIFSGFSKIVLSLCMLIGRLEIFPILILFFPSTWRRT